MIAELTGQIERVTYYNEENGYTVARLKVQGRQGLVTIVGNLPNLNPGEILKLKGEWQTHARFGEQFKIVEYESVVPATAVGIERYLSSGMIKGIGPVMASRLVKRFAINTLDIIEHEADRLKEVEGIGEKRVEMIRVAWGEQKEIREVMIFLQGHGVSPAYATKIFRHYKNDAIRVVRDNPYRLAEEVFGIGFLTADRIAEKLGIPKDSLLRIESGLQYVLHQLSDQGHVYYPFEPLIEECMKVLGAERAVVLQALDTAAADRKIIVDEASATSPETGPAVYLSVLHASETGTARLLRSLLEHPKQLHLLDRAGMMEAIQEELKIALSTLQVRAVGESLQRKVMVITGGPGTGKTTIIKAIIRLYGKQTRKILLAAPTGRAAKRMHEATGHEAKTIHRLLEFSPREGKFKKDENDPLDADLIVIDEASMIDTPLMYQFLRAVPAKATLILVGDVDQLPSVGPGNVLRDVIDSGVIPTVRLDEIFRQSRESMIIVNAHRVNRGEMPITDPDEGSKPDFFFIPIEEPEKVLERIVSLCGERIPERFGFHPLNDIQVLTPMHRGVVGATNLNIELQRHLNPSGDELARGGRTFRSGDKVMQIRNNYDKDVYNGDIGRIKRIDREEQEVAVDFDGRIVSYDFSELDELVLAYATSVHKAQGSEYPAVVIPVLTQHYVLLQRNLLYTGITRGKKLVVLVGTRKALSIAIHNNKPQKRYSRLRERLANG